MKQQIISEKSDKQIEQHFYMETEHLRKKLKEAYEKIKRLEAEVNFLRVETKKLEMF